jgi:hypothetical protein
MLLRRQGAEKDPAHPAAWGGIGIGPALPKEER